MSKRFTVFIAVGLITIFLVGMTVLILRRPHYDDAVGYLIILESLGSTDVVLQVPAPYIDGRVISELIDVIEARGDHEVTYSKRIVETRYGKMLEIRVSQFSGELCFSGVFVKKDIVRWDGREGLNIWPNPYLLDGVQMPSENQKYMILGKGVTPRTWIYSRYAGEPVRIRKLVLSTTDIEFLFGVTYFGYFVENVTLCEDGWQNTVLEKGGATNY